MELPELSATVAATGGKATAVVGPADWIHARRWQRLIPCTLKMLACSCI